MLHNTRREPLNRERHYFPIPTPERRRREKPMAVAIACAFQEGVMFCADTKITTGQQKSHESKIQSSTVRHRHEERRYGLYCCR